jgi:PspA/IM30 family
MIVSVFLATIFLSSKVVGAYIVSTTTTSFSRSSFVARRRHTLDSFGTPTLQHKMSTATATTLHMNLFDRFSRVAKSNLNNILQSLEDPEKIMTQALEDMQVRAFVHMILCITHHMDVAHFLF